MSLGEKYLLPPYRCCGVSTRRAAPGNGRYQRGHICDICGWSYIKDGVGGWKRSLGGRHQLKKHDRTEIDK